jgi:hypothetical protein
MKQTILLAIATQKHRYWLGTILYFLLFLGIIFVATNIQTGLSHGEQQSAVTSTTLSLSSESLERIVDLPYHLLQKASIHFLGVTTLGIKAPSLFIGLLIAIALLPLLTRWLLRTNIALFSGFIAISNGQFIHTMSLGSPLIMTVFWGVFIFLVGLLYVKQPQSIVRYIGLVSCLALSLYTPLSIYMVTALCLLAVLHPRLRYIVAQIPVSRKIVGVFFGSIIIMPLLVGLWAHPEQLWKILGIPTMHIDGSLLRYNITSFLKLYGTFWYGTVGPAGISPVFGVASLCLILFGAMRLARDLHAARSYGLIVLFPLLLIPIILQPIYAVVLFIPLTLLLAIGIEGLLDEWYQLFPFNPYARVAALAPTVILLSSITISNVSFYTNVMLYSENLQRQYNYDLLLVRSALTTHPRATIITPQENRDFFDLLRKDYPDIAISDQGRSTPITKGKTYIVTAGADRDDTLLGTPTTILASSFKEQSNRVYVYRAR